MLELIFLEGSQKRRNIRLNFQKAWFGREPTCDFVIDEKGVSRNHFVIQKLGENYILTDNQSTNGTFVDGLRIVEMVIRPGQQIIAGANLIQVRELAGEHTEFRFIAEWKATTGVAQIFEKSKILLGRKNTCDIQLDEPAISRVHAEIERDASGIWISDKSGGGGVYINARRVVRQQLRHGDTITIGFFEIKIGLSEEMCALEIQPYRKDSQILGASIPANYRKFVGDPRPSNTPSITEIKPSAGIAARPVWVQDTAPIWVPTSDILPNRFRSRMVVASILATMACAAYPLASKQFAVYSPGPTSSFHTVANAKFEKRLEQNDIGSECSACHTGFARVNAASCQLCHSESKPAKAHEVRGVACAGCHSEHNGPQFNIARNVGAGCQAAGCHVQVHQKQLLLIAQQKPPEGPTKVPTSVAFEVIFKKSGDPLHVQHADLKEDCDACHVPGNPKIKVPRETMRMKCLACHTFGQEATLRERCYSCHFEHPGTGSKKVLATIRFPDSPATDGASSNPRTFSGVFLFLAMLTSVPILYCAVMAVRLHQDQRLAGINIAASLPVQTPSQSIGLPAILELPPLAVQADAKPTVNPAPGGIQRPQINLDLCVGCGACVHVCPFNVLEVVNEKAIAARLEDCTGYAACAAECPTNAIQLVAGGAMQTTELPFYTSGLETNIPGLFLAGEVTGKALIKVAINQGKQVVESILKNRPQPGEHFDLIVVGAGPAGTSAALSAMKENLKVLVLEQGTTANTIRHYPRQKFIMAEPVMMPLHGPLWMEDSSKEGLLDRWQKIISSTGLAIQEMEKVLSIAQGQEHFVVKSTNGEYRGARVVIAIGRRGSPRKLGVPGEDSAKVVYNLLDAGAYVNKAICVVGGGDAGIETANGLARKDLGNRVWLVHRGEDFSKAKPRNEKKINKSVEAGRVKVFFNAAVVEIRDGFMSIKSAAGVTEIENDFVFIQVGGESPKKFLSECGIEFSQRPLV